MLISTNNTNTCIRKTQISFTSLSQGLIKVKDGLKENLNTTSKIETNYLPGRFAIGTEFESKKLSEEVNIDPRLLSLYHINCIGNTNNIDIPDNMENPSLSRLNGLVKNYVEDGKVKSILTDKAIDSHGFRRMGGDWLKNSVMSNIMLRGDTAWDSDHNGKIDLKNQFGVNESGTFLKAINILPHLANMHVDTIYLNPINSIGEIGRKGEAGSPYAIKDFYEINPDFDDPSTKTNCDDEFKAFVDASHKQNMRVMLDFVFRIAAYDNSLLIDRPEWCYWRNHNSRSPRDIDNNVTPCVSKIEDAMLEAYKRKFNKLPDDGKKIVIRNNIMGDKPNLNQDLNTITWKDANLTPKEILDALKDIYGVVPTQAGPPDLNDPQVWSDATFLRIGKNDPPIEDLWKYIENVIPYYQNKFGIDSARIDMAHDINPVLFDRIIDKAKGVDPDFSFFAEDFCADYSTFWRGDGTKKPENKKFNAACGNIHWIPSDHPEISPNELKRWESGYISDWAFNKAQFSDGLIWGTPETHDSFTRSAASNGGILHSKESFLRYSFYPKMFPAIVGGFELGEEVRKKKDNEVEKCILFDYKGLDSWLNPDEENGYKTQYSENATKISGKNIIDYIRKVTEIRNKYKDIVTDLHSDSFYPINTNHSSIYAFARIPMTRHKDGHINNKALLIVQNMNSDNPEYMSISKNMVQNMLRYYFSGQNKSVPSVENLIYTLTDELTGDKYVRRSADDLFVSLKRGQSHIFSLSIE